MNFSSRKRQRPYTNFWSENKLFLPVPSPMYFTCYDLLLVLFFVFLVLQRTNLMPREVAVTSISVTVLMQFRCE